MNEGKSIVLAGGVDRVKMKNKTKGERKKTTTRISVFSSNCGNNVTTFLRILQTRYDGPTDCGPKGMLTFLD